LLGDPVNRLFTSRMTSSRFSRIRFISPGGAAVLGSYSADHKLISKIAGSKSSPFGVGL
jgi:hypothetical protein